MAAGREPRVWGRRCEERVRKAPEGAKEPGVLADPRKADSPLGGTTGAGPSEEDSRQPSEEAPSEGLTLTPGEEEEGEG